ncbi:hypothetical protein [Trichlorobacter ammonificans]|uniref:Methyltransf_11 domain-containing protein n=1 Tax=Trichlorobacter ammonificans TaxID=2916410 RepID=A0ABN8HM46_9BACT|nr:hypothetical protein [Trichlorobacter ammonificans]CAH2031082.1 Methyltransf_11 domain-containing protein [Trichlorobacter ammonificans]
MKLHLGCGQRYLEGYVNIDFPLSSHTVQTESVADLHTDITTLRYLPGSVAEVRLHHLFEHFPRPVACGLLACWHSWLHPGGLLRIEVPDFSRTARIVLNPFSSFRQRAVAERHLFGSHEAPWAVHCEGYTPAMLKQLVGCFGFTPLRLERNAWCGTCNIELYAVREEGIPDRESAAGRADRWLRQFLLDENVEQRLHATWMEQFAEQLDKGWAT